MLHHYWVPLYFHKKARSHSLSESIHQEQSLLTMRFAAAVAILAQSLVAASDPSDVDLFPEQAKIPDDAFSKQKLHRKLVNNHILDQVKPGIQSIQNTRV